MERRIILSGGGTAGHIYPAVAIGLYLKEKYGAKLLYIGSENSMEQRIVPTHEIEFESIRVQGLKRSLSPKAILYNINTFTTLNKAKKISANIIQKFKPNVVIGTGGYVSAPVLKTAQQLGIKTAIHEQNAIAGVTNKLLSQDADICFLASADALSSFNKARETVICGNPVRKTILEATKIKSKEKLNLNDNPTILSFGGSLGARTINDSILPLIEYAVKDGNINIIHAHGKNGFDIKDKLLERNIDINKLPHNVKVTEFINDMGLCLSSADLVISRAGALTLAEIAAKGKASILIPSPNVTANHQYHNAKSYQNANASILLEEKDIKETTILELVKELIKDKDRLDSMGMCAKALHKSDTLKVIAESIMSLIE